MSAPPPRRPWLGAALLRSSLCAGVLAGCGAEAPRPVPAEGEREWLVRQNPPACLLDQPALHFEVRLGETWSRVLVEGPGPGGEESALQLARLFAADPRAIRVVRGDLSRRFQAFAGGHPAQVLRLESVTGPDGEPLPPEPPEGAPLGEEGAPGEGGEEGAPAP